MPAGRFPGPRGTHQDSAAVVLPCRRVKPRWAYRGRQRCRRNKPCGQVLSPAAALGKRGACRDPRHMPGAAPACLACSGVRGARGIRREAGHGVAPTLRRSVSAAHDVPGQAAVCGLRNDSRPASRSAFPAMAPPAPQHVVTSLVSMKRPTPVLFVTALGSVRGSSDACSARWLAWRRSHRHKGADRHVQCGSGRGADPSGDGHLT